MSTSLIVAAFLLAAAPLFVLAQGGDAAAGKALFDKSCRACHGADGKGNPAIVKLSKGAMQDLGSKEVQSRTDEQLAKDAAGGTAAKKPLKPIAEKDMKNVIAFIRTLAAK